MLCSSLRNEFMALNGLGQLGQQSGYYSYITAVTKYNENAYVCSSRELSNSKSGITSVQAHGSSVSNHELLVL